MKHFLTSSIKMLLVINVKEAGIRFLETESTLCSMFSYFIFQRNILETRLLR